MIRDKTSPLLPLTVLILTKDAQDHIASCVKSVEWAEHILILDNSTNDETAALARSQVPHVDIHPVEWKGYGPTKNYGLTLARHPWVLWLDSDETLSLELIDHLKQNFRDLTQDSKQAFSFIRHNYFMGQWIQHSGWYPDRVTRLFNKNSFILNEHHAHESLITKDNIKGSIVNIQLPILHQSYQSIDQYFNKISLYAKLSAQDRVGKKVSLWKAFFHIHFGFIRSFFLRKGFLDGKAGLILAFGSMFYLFIRYVYLIYPSSQKK